MKYIIKSLLVGFLLAFASIASAFSMVDCTVATDRLALGGGSTELDQADCEFLDSIYTDTAPGAWVDSTNWDTLTDVNTWFGVTRSGTNVTEVQLGSNNLVGAENNWILPSALEVLDLRSNAITGEIADWILPLSLIELNLGGGNSFSGNIASWGIGASYVNLEQFVLNNNSFSGDLTTWALPPAIQIFQLNVNDFTGDISSWVLPSTLTDFRIVNNDFTGDISSWVLPSGLQNFYPRQNQLSGDVSSWVIPSSIINFQIYDNDFTGDISSWVIPSTAFSFMLQRNNFFADISSWVIPSTLDVFNASDNGLFGNIPDFTSASSIIPASSSIDNNSFTTASTTNDAAADTALGEDWSATQTIAPTNASTTAQTATTTTISVDPYEYVSTGDFNVLWGTTSTGPYTTGSTTAARSAGTDFVISGLTENTLYFGVVEAETPANAGGNILVATSSEFLMILQTTPDLATTSDDGISNTDNITEDTTPEIVGSCVTGTTVTVYVDGVAIAPTATCAAGAYSVTPSVALTAGATYSITHTQTDTGSGLESGFSPALSITIDQDTDGDGFPDTLETAAGTNPNDATSVPADTDGDGFPDYYETAVASPATDPNDASSFPVSPDALATDTDTDGYPDWLEVVAGSDPGDSGSIPADTDGDLVPDVVEDMQGTDDGNPRDFQDTDGDLVPDYIESQFDSTDTTDATVGGYLDTDGDLVPDYVEETWQVLAGGSAATDANDNTVFLDTDTGGTPDYVETVLFVNEGLAATDINVAADDNQDSDSQSPGDYQELLNGTDPLVRISTGGGGGGSLPRVCRDPDASNYSQYGRSDSRLCEYEDDETDSVTGNDTAEDPDTEGNTLFDLQPFFLLNTSFTNPSANDVVEVNKVIEFLNDNEGENLAVDGSYDQDDFEAIKRFQEKYSDEVLAPWGLTEATGFVGITTRLKMNMLYNNIQTTCPAFIEFNRIDRNNTSAEIARAKALLRGIGFYQGEVGTVFTPAFDSAMRTFQKTFSAVILDPWGLTAPTGYKYQSTNKFLNFLVGCNTDVRLDNGVLLNY